MGGGQLPFDLSSRRPLVVGIRRPSGRPQPRRFSQHGHCRAPWESWAFGSSSLPRWIPAPCSPTIRSRFGAMWTTPTITTRHSSFLSTGSPSAARTNCSSSRPICREATATATPTSTSGITAPSTPRRPPPRDGHTVPGNWYQGDKGPRAHNRLLLQRPGGRPAPRVRRRRRSPGRCGIAGRDCRPKPGGLVEHRQPDAGAARQSDHRGQPPARELQVPGL